MPSPVAIGQRLSYHGKHAMVTGTGVCHWCKECTLTIRTEKGELLVVHASEVEWLFEERGH